jgi:hypothetical protein
MMSFTVESYLKALLCEAVVAKRHTLYLNDSSLTSAFAAIIKELHAYAKRAYDSGNEELCHEILRVLDALSPNPNTGSFDGFYTRLRNLQPGLAGIGNPALQRMDLRASEAHSRQSLDDIPEEWKKIVQDSARHLVEVA